MKVQELMSRDVRLARPEQTIRDVARLMQSQDIGAMPVEENDRLAGMITDRDIAVRAVAAGHGPDTRVSEVMTRGIKYCFDDQELDEVAANMAKQQLRRMPVVNRERRLVGILAIADVARRELDAATAKAIEGISKA
ncbi:MAG: CBS domain-containing protein [Lautropia sp.]